MTIFRHRFGCLVNFEQTGISGATRHQVEDSGPGIRALAVSQPLNLEAPKKAVLHVEVRTQIAAPLFIQKDVEEGVVNPNLAVIFDEAQFSEAIHKKTHS